VLGRLLLLVCCSSFFHHKMPGFRFPKKALQLRVLLVWSERD
jgi:hypothetical protein